MMLDSRVYPLPPPPPVFGMSLLGGERRLLERGALVPTTGGLGPVHGGFGRPLTPRLWRPAAWGSPPPPCPPMLPALPLCPEPCHLSAPGLTHLFDYMASARLWYPWHYKGESLYSSLPGVDNAYEVRCRSPGGGKELPSRTLKGERLKERQELTQVLQLDSDHAAAICAARKAVTATASTQTQFSSFNGDGPPPPPPPPGYPGPPPGPPPAYYAPRGDPPIHGDYSVTHHPPYASLHPPPPHPSHRSSSPVRSVELGHVHADVQNAPLNLSLSSSSPCSGSSLHSVSSSRPSVRPSVITCMLSPSPSSLSPPVVVSSSSGRSSPRSQNGLCHSGSPRSSSPPAVSDPAIEEHFRRSLGKSYRDSSVPATSSPNTMSVQSNVSITGSVDDHFAKALGDSTWKAIKSQRDSNNDIFTSSVDDHFAKALGANTWRRIKAETELSENAASLSSACGNSCLPKINGSGANMNSCVTSSSNIAVSVKNTCLSSESNGLNGSSSANGNDSPNGTKNTSSSPARSGSLGAPVAT